jgi:radical SAM protein with 4Fe4S-binding SPASM domain
MRLKTNPVDSDVPFFPFPIRKAKENGYYETENHHIAKPIRLNRHAAEVLRLADGQTPLSEIVSRLTERYTNGEGPETIRSQIVDLLRFLTNKELLWWRQVPLEPVPVGPPPSLFWEITSACNLRCLHCVVGAGEKLSQELTTQRCLELAEELAGFGVESVAFSGGEPLMHPDFCVIAERVRNLGMTFQVATNGTLLTPEMARWLRDMDAGVQVSLDGSTPEIHDHMRPGHQAFTRTIAGIRELVAAGHDVMIGTVLSTVNLKDIPSIVKLTGELGAVSFRLIPFVPKGRGEHFANMEVPPHEIKNVVRYLHELRDRTRLNISPLEFEEMLDGGSCMEPVDLKQGLGCSGAVAYATITPTGELLPCHFFEGVRADSVASTPFREVWHRSRFLNYFRHLTVADLHGACRDCSWLAHCGGSCRAVNFAKGDLFGSNLSCWIAVELEEKMKNGK